MSLTSDSAPVVQMRGITIEFPGVRALDGVDLTLRPGEVHALMGENGAGKSTMIKALTGVYQVDSGEIRVGDRPHRFHSTAQAQEAGISTVYQEVNLCGNLSVAENVMLGHEVRFGPFINWPATRRKATEYLARLNLDIDPSSQLGSHSIAVQQLCSIARAMVVDARVLILDEPTSSLDKAEVAELFAIVRQLRDSGVAILFVSHFLEQIYEISDRMTILRNGRFVGEYRTAELPRLELISKMLGRASDELAAIEAGAQRVAHDEQRGTPLLSAVRLGRQGSIEPVDLEVYEGEIVGFAGLLGSGRTELARLLYGADRADEGELTLFGEQVRSAAPLSSLKGGLAYSTEDRKREGIIAELTVRENIALAVQASRGIWRRIPAKELDEIVERYVQALNIQPPNPNMVIRNLSGGNQQKAVLAKWLLTEPRILIMDEPTRGIDVGAKAEIYSIMNDLVARGMAIIMVSSELNEIINMCDRLVIMNEGKIVAELDRNKFEQDSILHYALGGAVK